MLEIKDLCFSVEDGNSRNEILNHVNLTVEDHKFVVITGPNGGGKTTLAKAVMGLVQPTSGQILWNGTDITHMSITERARLGVSYGFQQPPRFKGMKVRDLLALAAGTEILWNGTDITHMSITERARLGVSYVFQQPPRFKGMKVRDLLALAAGNETLTRTEECQYLNKVGLCAGDYIDRDVDTSLSGGEVKRIEIATILARKAGLMIFDEPEAGIDLWSFAKLTETFRAIHDKQESTLLIISHQERILNQADEIVMIADGAVTCHGPKEEIFPTILANTAAVGCSFLEEGN